MKYKNRVKKLQRRIKDFEAGQTRTKGPKPVGKRHRPGSFNK